MRLINDYYHIFLYHKYDEDDFEFIYSHLPTTVNSSTSSRSVNDKCNVISCNKIKRNERRRGEENVKQRHRLMSVHLRDNYFGYKDIKEITCIQLLDRIHSVLYHSFDLFRLTQSEQRLIRTQKHSRKSIDESESKSNHFLDAGNLMNISVSDDSHYELFVRSLSMDESVEDRNSYIDHNFAAMHKIMKSKQTKLIQIRTQFNRNSNKFVTQLPDPDDEKTNNMILNANMNAENTTHGNIEEHSLADIAQMAIAAENSTEHEFYQILKIKTSLSS